MNFLALLLAPVALISGITGMTLPKTKVSTVEVDGVSHVVMPPWNGASACQYEWKPGYGVRIPMNRSEQTLKGSIQSRGE